MSTQNTTVRINITGGDSKFELFRQLMLVGLKLEEHHQLFRIKGLLDGTVGSSLGIHEDYISITGIQAEDGSGDSWNISGNYPSMIPTSAYRRRGGTFTGYYNTRTRQGYILVTFS